MSKVIHLISDLHLCENQPHLLSLFEHYMLNIATESQQLYVLGDLFEVWVGDDNLRDFNHRIIELFKNYTEHHGELFIAHGNRDFLLGKTFAKICGATLIEEPFLLTWEKHSICLMHGDSLCTDDTAYQDFRKQVRSEQWQSEFLGMDIKQRIEIASNLRDHSKSAQQQKSYQIMDVNSQAVKQCFIENHCEWLIHGHTHREGIHRVSLDNDNIGTRIVLSDWGQKGHYLKLDKGRFNSCYFECD